MANKQLSTSVEETIEVKPMGGSSMGFYFSMTDKAWKSGDPKDYKYGTSGVLYVGNLMPIFTILTNDKESAIVKLSLDMLKMLNINLEVFMTLLGHHT